MGGMHQLMPFGGSEELIVAQFTYFEYFFLRN
jgi:hypothetical protein